MPAGRAERAFCATYKKESTLTTSLTPNQQTLYLATNSEMYLDSGPENHELLAQLNALLYEEPRTPVTFVLRPRHLGPDARQDVPTFVDGMWKTKRDASGVMLYGTIVQRNMRFEAYYKIMTSREGWFKIM